MHTVNENADIVDELFLEGLTYTSPIPAIARDFLPWHRPRKQFVRTRQWQSELRALLTEYPLANGAILSYLGLPGADLLDLRHLHSNICTPDHLAFRFLGFNSQARPGSESYDEMSVSLDEVRRLKLVDEQSQIISDDFVLLSNTQSYAFSRAKLLGPFDVVNLDLCDGFGKQTPGAAHNTYYNAISKLMTLQSRNSRPWLLFLTTRADRPTVHADVLEKVSGIYKNNLNTCEDFRAASAARFAVNDQNLDEVIQTASGHMRIFITGLSKWFISLALQGVPQVGVHLRSAMGYRIANNSTEIDMVSLAFRCVPSDMGYPDPMGLVGPQAQTLHEAPLALKALNKVASMKNVDLLIKENSELKAELVESMAALVQLARYDSASYRAWVENEDLTA